MFKCEKIINIVIHFARRYFILRGNGNKNLFIVEMEN